jgi:hypothetical protein
MSLPPLEPVRRVRIVHENEATRKALVRRAMVAIAERCAWSGASFGVDLGGTRGARGADRVALFRQITEGRGMAPSYSTCGDVVNWCLASMGVRYEGLINRTDDNLDGIDDAKQLRGLGTPFIAGGSVWQVGRVITKLVQGSRDVGCWVEGSTFPKRRPRAGDCGLVGRDGAEHVFVFTSDVEECEDQLGVFQFSSVDGGQFDGQGQCVKAFHENLIRRSQVAGAWTAGRSSTNPGRPLMGWIDLDRAPMPGPALVPASFTDGCEPWEPLGAPLGRIRARSQASRRATCVKLRRCSSRGSKMCDGATSGKGSTRSSAQKSS